MENDSKVMGVFGRQLPQPDCNPSEKRDLLTYLGKKRVLKKLNLKNNIEKERYKDNIEKFIQFSNVNSACRYETLQKFPFNEKILMCEDQEWCRRILEAGYKVAYEPKAAVYHSHNFSIKNLYKRNYDFGLSFKKFVPTNSNLTISTLRAVKNIFQDWFYLRKYDANVLAKAKWFFVIPFMRFAIFYGKYKGLTYEK
jgi:rhamnosyltransferase